MALEDQVTGLTNRNYFFEHLDLTCHALSQSDEIDGQEFCVLQVDIDQFKRVNDSLGHTIGDGLLREIANRLQTCIGEGDNVSRFGGDEFSILLRSKVGVQGGEEMAEKILTHLARPFLIQGQTVNLCCSIGMW